MPMMFESGKVTDKYDRVTDYETVSKLHSVVTTIDELEQKFNTSIDRAKQEIQENVDHDIEGITHELKTMSNETNAMFNHNSIRIYRIDDFIFSILQILNVVLRMWPIRFLNVIFIWYRITESKDIILIGR